MIETAKQAEESARCDVRLWSEQLVNVFEGYVSSHPGSRDRAEQIRSAAKRTANIDDSHAAEFYKSLIGEEESILGNFLRSWYIFIPEQAALADGFRRDRRKAEALLRKLEGR